MKEVEHDFLSCDWGTTSFRLRWVSGSERRVVREIREQAGVKVLYEEALRLGASTESDRAEVFARFLREKLEQLLAREELPELALPLVISGMASSSVGWRELPYASTPFPLDGRGLRAEELTWDKPNWLGRTYLISGVAHQHDMMRGEETEIIGLMSDPGLGQLRERSLLILPGTHSKHVWIENQSVVDFRTFMTGELFEVLGRHSLLRASVNMEDRVAGQSLSESERTAFQEGVLCAKGYGLPAALFRVRTRVVLGRHPLGENTWFMSGLLIGAELSDLAADGNSGPVLLAAARALSELYTLAFQALGGTARWIQVPPEQTENASIAAHALFLLNKENAA